jgi:hypothetical protein
MRAPRKDAIATVLVTAVVVAYAGYLARGDLPLIHDARGMAGVGLVLGLAACITGAQEVTAHDRLLTVVIALGTTATVLGITAVATENGLVLAAFMVSIVAAWLVATVRHGQSVARASHQAPTGSAAHA